MSHPILNEHPAMAGFRKQRVELSAAQDKARVDQTDRAAAYQEALDRATTEGTVLPTPPQSAEALEAAFQAQMNRIDSDQQAWLTKHRDELVDLAYGRQREVMADVARIGDKLNDAAQEISLLNSMLGHLAFQTQTPRHEVAPSLAPVALLDLAARGGQPLRPAGEQPAPPSRRRCSLSPFSPGSWSPDDTGNVGGPRSAGRRSC